MKKILLGLLPLVLTSCINPISFWFPPDLPFTKEGDRIVYFIRPGGNDSGKGDAANPMGSLQAAFNRIRTSWRDDNLGKKFTFRVAGGTYTPGQGLTSQGLYGAFLDTSIHSDGTFIMDVEISFGWNATFNLQDTPVQLNGRGQVAKVLVFRVGGVENTITGASPPDWLIAGGWHLALKGLNLLTVTP